MKIFLTYLQLYGDSRKSSQAGSKWLERARKCDWLGVFIVVGGSE